MKTILIFIGAALVAYLLALGIRAFNGGRRGQPPTRDDAQ